MKTAVIDGLEYPLFEKIRDKLVFFIPETVGCQYSKLLKRGIFNFEDSHYVPNCMWRFVLGNKGNVDLRMRMNRELTEILDANDFGVGKVN